MTKDERFLAELYRTLHGDLEGSVDPNAIAEKLGYNERLIKNILKGLMRANLVARYSPEEIGLTARGLEVAQSLSP